MMGPPDFGPLMSSLIGLGEIPALIKIMSAA
jgi:hypothetical protein